MLNSDFFSLDSEWKIFRKKIIEQSNGTKPMKVSKKGSECVLVEILVIGKFIVSQVSWPIRFHSYFKFIHTMFSVWASWDAL